MADDTRLMLPQNRAEWLACLLLIGLVVVAFSSVSSNEFVNYDDGVYIHQNPQVQRGLSPSMLRWAFTTGYASNWHPLTWIAHTINWDLFGASPRGHHWASVLLHALTACVLFLVLARTTGPQPPPRAGRTANGRKQQPRGKELSAAAGLANELNWPAAFVAALFAVHPLRVESVAWAAELKDVLCALFWWLSIAAYVRYARSPGVGGYLLVALCFVLGLLSKPMIVTLPIVLLLLDYWPLERFPAAAGAESRLKQAARLAIEKLPLLGLAGLSAVATYVAQSRGGTTTLLEHVPLPLRLANGAIATVAYLRDAVWPVNLACFYPYPQAALRSGGLAQPEALASIAVVVALSIAAAWLGRRYRYFAVGWFWYLITLVPVIGIIQVGRQARADRYTYLPLVGIAIIVVYGLHDLLAKNPRWQPRARAAGATLVLLLAVMTWRQTRVWHDDLTLFSHAARVIPRNETAEMNLGTKLVQLGRVDEGIEHLKLAIECRPDYAAAYRNLGIALESAGQPRQAEICFRKGLELQPDWALLLCNLAMLYATSQDPALARPAEAVKLASRADELTGGADLTAIEVLSTAQIVAGNLPEAIAVTERAVAAARKTNPRLAPSFERRLTMLRERAGGK